MLIASRFKRPKAPVDLPGKTYFFVPVDPSNPDSEHVAEVADNDHIQRLLAIPEGYYIAQADTLPTAVKPVVTSAGTGATGTVATATTATTTNTGEQGSDAPPPSDDATTTPAEILEAATNLNALTWQKLQSVLKQGAPTEVIKAALDIELAKPEADQRATTIKLLTQAVESGAA